MGDETRLTERVRREMEAHTEADVLAQSYGLKDRFPHIWSYPSRRRLLAQMQNHLERLHGKVVLDYGCGRGYSSMRYLAEGAMVHGIDISPVYITEAQGKVSDAGFADACSFRVMDAHSLDFQEDTFDLVVGEGILHHLESEVALAEIHRVLKPGGRVLLLEPLADNPLLRLFRWLTPRARTADEAPFTGQAVSRLVRNDRWKSETSYCGLLEAPIAMITSVLMRSSPNNIAIRLADQVERWMHARGWLLSWNQYILFNLVKK